MKPVDFIHTVEVTKFELGQLMPYGTRYNESKHQHFIEYGESCELSIYESFFKKKQIFDMVGEH